MSKERLRDDFFSAARRYWYLEDLGHGGTSVVFKVRDLEVEEIIALKVYWSSFPVEDGELLARARREIRLNRQIKHPNVARLYDFGKAGSLFYLSMEYIPGKNLESIVRAQGALPASRAVAILRQIALGAGAAHERGIVHRDLKSSNVLVGHRDAVAILDFGLAMRSVDQSITPQGRTVGTPCYMSPEQALGSPTDARSDIYSIGIIAFNLLTGTLPFVGRSPLETMAMHVSDPVPPSLDEVPGVPPELRAIVLRCLEKDPALRYPSAGELAHAIANVASLTGRPAVSVPTPGAREPATAEDRGRRPVVLVVDDDEEIRAQANLRFRAAGLDVRAADSGTEALDALRGGSVDILLMDVWMPMLDGFDVVRRLRAERPDLDIPIFLMTAATDRHQIAFAMNLGVSDILEKSAGLDAMAARLWFTLHERGF